MTQTKQPLAPALARRFPATKTVWTYRGIYQLNDARVGVWSQSVSIAVMA